VDGGEQKGSRGASLSSYNRITMLSLRHRSLLLFLAVFPICELAATTLPPGQTVLFDYYTQAFGQNPVTQSGSFPALAAGPDLICNGPDGLPLFRVDFSPDSLTIAALRGFQNNLSLEFRWAFSLPAGGELSFNSATLRSSTLFSIPPFTFPVEPTVVFDPVSRRISITRFIAAGSGTATVNEDGAAVVDFTVVPEPSVSVYVAISGILIFAAWMRRRKRPASPGVQCS
jgi:hypothetical protein